MGMFDGYRPATQHCCPVCQRPLRQWQGKDGPCGLLVRIEGTPSPIDEVMNDDDIRSDLARLAPHVLPPRFLIYSYDCPEHHPIDAMGHAPDGLWSGTFIRPFGAPRPAKVREPG
jgi:hypothetical protein